MLSLPKSDLTLFFKDVSYFDTASGFDFMVRIDERPAKQLAQSPANCCFPGAHGADKNDRLMVLH
jgi:hypothetical protein